MIALQGIVIDRIIFIKVKGDHIFKAQLFFFMHSYKFAIQRAGCRASGKPKNTFLFFAFCFSLISSAICCATNTEPC